MEDKKQESQKTVVAFVAGLLIGGLLVWVFSLSPEAAAPEVEENGGETSDVRENVADVPEDTEVSMDNGSEVEAGSFSVADQPAGTEVSLGSDVMYPSGEGWIVVHEEVGGGLGNALGAARYETAVGLLPTSVRLLRATEAGVTYHVVYYGENGDDRFDMRVDTPLTTDGAMVEATFIAQ